MIYPKCHTILHDFISLSFCLKPEEYSLTYFAAYEECNTNKVWKLIAADIDIIFKPTLTDKEVTIIQLTNNVNFTAHNIVQNKEVVNTW